MQFVPENQLSVSGIEHGTFICYEVKSCKADFLSGHGQNFIGEKNYLVMTMSTYKELYECGEISKIPHKVGILVAMPYSKKYKKDRIELEYNNPTSLENQNTDSWYLETVKRAYTTHRSRSALELLFCMLRSKKK